MNRGIIITNRQLWNRVTSIQKLGAIAVIGTRTLPCSAARYQSTQSQTQLRCSEQESAEKIQDKPIPTNANPNDSVNVSVQVGHQQYSVTRSGIPIRSLILGAPGSGKGTQTKKLRGDFDLTAISSGDLLRKSISAGNEIGKQVAKLVERGEFVPDELMVQVVQHELGSVINQNWIIDGFPRTAKQAQELDVVLDKMGMSINTVLSLEVSVEEILSRIVDRYVHVPSGRVYNRTYNAPRVWGIDDVTGEPLEHRADDNVEVFIKARMVKYREETEPLKEYYAKRGILKTFEGNESDVIYPQIQQYLVQKFY